LNFSSFSKSSSSSSSPNIFGLSSLSSSSESELVFDFSFLVPSVLVSVDFVFDLAPPLPFPLLFLASLDLLSADPDPPELESFLPPGATLFC